MKLLVIIVGKLLIVCLRLIGKNGSALPGLIAERLYPQLIHKQLDQLESGVVVVTGTNGKTTTTKSLVYLLQQCGMRVVTNPTGSNFTRGIYATLIKYSSISGVLDYDVAVLELDEAYSRIFAKKYQPRLVLALNVMRDQLDRYGEIDTTAKMIGQAVALAKEGAVLNSNDRRVRELARQTDAEVSYFGVSQDLLEHLPTEDDFEGISIHPPKHRKKPKRNKKSSGTAGPRLSVTLTDYQPGSAGFGIGDKVYHTSLRIAGIHNAFNLAAALATTMRVCPDMEPQFIVPSMKDIPAAFGRGEVIKVGEQNIVLALVKNPSGFRQSLESYDASDFGAIAFVINDEFADGRDVSWLWDVDFKHLQKSKDNDLFTAGTRGADMALRLKYDELQAKQVKSLDGLINKLLGSGAESSIIFCTYTAMLDLRKRLAAKTDIEGMWR